MKTKIQLTTRKKLTTALVSYSAVRETTKKAVIVM